jgi:hypothetical protein
VSTEDSAADAASVVGLVFVSTEDIKTLAKNVEVLKYAHTEK